MTDAPLVLILRRLSQPIGEFFVGVLPADELRRNAEPEPRKVIDKDEKTEGVQRSLNQERVKEIREYLQTADASSQTQ